MTVEEKVVDLVKRSIDKKQEVKLDSKLIEELGVDSFDKLMILGSIEDAFSITINEEDFRDLVTVRDIVAKLKTKYPEIEE